jgi:hypothetical protein
LVVAELVVLVLSVSAVLAVDTLLSAILPFGGSSLVAVVVAVVVLTKPTKTAVQAVAQT